LSFQVFTWKLGLFSTAQCVEGFINSLVSLFALHVSIPRACDKRCAWYKAEYSLTREQDRSTREEKQLLT